MKTYTQFIIEAFIDNVFGKIKTNTSFMKGIKNAKTKIDNIASSTTGTYKSVGKDGVKALIGDVAYLISKNDKIKMEWEKGVYKDLSVMNDQTKKKIIDDMYNNSGKGFNDIHNIIEDISNTLQRDFKWSNFNQDVYDNENTEPDDQFNYELFIEILQNIAIQLKKEGK